MEIIINEYYEPDHSRAINEDNYNLSRTCDEQKNDMHHIHDSCEILFVEEGAADYYISGQKYYVEGGDILIIGAMEHHQRRIDRFPFLRYGLTIKPSYYKSLLLGDDLVRVFGTPDVETFGRNYKKVDPEVFAKLIALLKELRTEEVMQPPFRSQMERTIITQIAVILFRALHLEKRDTPLSAANVRMFEVKEYIEQHFHGKLDLPSLSERFFLHPATISKDFHKYCGYNLNKYINRVRVAEAAKLLESSNDTIALISAKCGYDSENTFTRQFRNIMEISPSQYRKALRSLYREARKKANSSE